MTALFLAFVGVLSVAAAFEEASTHLPTTTRAYHLDERLKIRLADIPSLTFKAGGSTRRNRTTPILQLRCIHGCTGDLPKAVRCTNRGFDGVLVSWRCEANLERGRRFEDTRVRCEAFIEGDREYILAGSCGLEYSLGGRAHGGDGRGVPYYPSANHAPCTNPVGHERPTTKPAVYVIPQEETRAQHDQVLTRKVALVSLRYNRTDSANLPDNVHDTHSLTFKDSQSAQINETTAFPKAICMRGCVGELPREIRCFPNHSHSSPGLLSNCEAYLEPGQKFDSVLDVRCDVLVSSNEYDAPMLFLLKETCILEYGLQLNNETKLEDGNAETTTSAS